jgi:UDP-N-acetylmuramate dehydrogenase
MQISQDYLLADAGVELASLSSFAAAGGLSGLEFSCGIPGSVGGAVYMNAGAYEGEIAQVLDFSVCLDLDEMDHYERISSGKSPHESAFPYKILALENAEHAFSYRKSIYQTRNLIMLYGVFQLKPANSHVINTKIHELTQAREAKQPLQYPSAGSIFKRPQGHFTGALIQQCNLSGYQIGGAAVSEQHCGFIINTGGATATDIIQLITHIQSVVYAQHGVTLTTEVKIIGCENPTVCL